VAEAVGAQMIVRVTARRDLSELPRYIPKMQLAEPSVYVPQPGCDPVEPAWKASTCSKGRAPKQPTPR